jgi:hypothetical protein
MPRRGNSKGNRSTANRVSTTTTVAKQKRRAAIKRARLPVPGVTFRENLNTHTPQKKMMANSNTVREIVCAITDPFCAKAKNAKWPDGMGGETMSMQIRTHVTFGALTAFTGNVCFFTPSLPFGALFAGAYTTSYNMNTTINDTQANSGFNTWAQTYRIVSAGVIVRNLLPALTAQGYVIISRMNQNPAVAGTGFVAGGTYGSDVSTHPITAGMEIPVISQSTGMASRMFQPLNANTAFNTGWDFIRIELVGPATGAATVDLEFVYNVEFTLPSAMANLHGFVVPTIPNAPHAITASGKLSSLVTSTAATSVESLSKMFLSKAAIAIEDVVGGGLALFGI